MNNERWTVIRHGHDLEVVDNFTKDITCILKAPFGEWRESSLREMVAHANRAYVHAEEEKREKTRKVGA